MVSKVTSLRKRAGMMRSVSMSLPGNGMPRPVIWRRFRSVVIRSLPRSARATFPYPLASPSAAARQSFQNLPDVGDGAGDGGRGDHGRAHQEGAPRGAALSPDEVAVAGR